MQRRHHVVLLLLLAGLVLRAGLAGYRSRPALTRPCRHPYLLTTAGQTRIYCGASPQLDARRLLTLAGHRCRLESSALRLELGDRLVLDDACRGQRQRSRGAERLLLGLGVDLNRASVAELRVLPRIGPKLAQRIVAERVRGGPFRSLEQLAPRVRGIGKRTVARLRGLATVGRRVRRGPRLRSAR